VQGGIEVQGLGIGRLGPGDIARGLARRRQIEREVRALRRQGQGGFKMADGAGVQPGAAEHKAQGVEGQGVDGPSRLGDLGLDQGLIAPLQNHQTQGQSGGRPGVVQVQSRGLA
jgi:hypothetical protein